MVFLAIHQILIAQRYFQKAPKTKGHILFIFDYKDKKNQLDIINFVKSPPDWTNSYYFYKNSNNKLNSIIDVPYFTNSKDVYLLQLADLIAFLLRRYIELNDGEDKERYCGEGNKINEWIKKISKICIDNSYRYPRQNRCECANLFFNCAPESLKKFK